MLKSKTQLVTSGRSFNGPVTRTASDEPNDSVAFGSPTWTNGMCKSPFTSLQDQRGPIRRAMSSSDTHASRSDEERPWPYYRGTGPLAMHAVCALLLPVVPGPIHAEVLSQDAFAMLARRCGAAVAPTTLAAIARTESGFRTLVVADNTTRRTRDFTTLAAAASVGQDLVARGHSVDLGVMQINSANLRRLRLTVAGALDPCRSIAGGAAILSQSYAGMRNVADPQVALRQAISRYNTGNSWAGYRNGYVHRVEMAARVLFGGGTATVTVASAHALQPPRSAPADDWNVWNVAAPSSQSPAASPSNTTLIF